MLRTCEANCYYSLRCIETLYVLSEDSMAAISVDFGHSAVISKNEKSASVNNGDSNPEL